MKDWCKYILTAIGGIAVGAIAMFCLNKCSGVEPAEPIIIHDSIDVHDTAYIAEHTEPLYVIRHDTMWIPAPASPSQSDSTLCDGRVTKDSIAVDIPITAYEYKDTFATDTSSIALAVRYSGYNAKIDSVGLQYRFEVQPNVVHDKKGWGQFVGVGVGVGYGLGCQQPLRFEPYVGVHVVYGFGYHW
ncbi:MAG: hypothetical protein J5621_09365 [Paludibacteraceae bacterium]|nr:hypothetical protein [Paludibacteraceae bacterium]